MSQLIIENISFARGDRAILRDISITHDTGSVLTLLGPSGSGKTTLLWLAAGLLKPDIGQVRFAQTDSMPPRIGFVFQDGALWEHLTVMQHLDVVVARLGEHRNPRRARIGRILDETGLTLLANRRPNSLSGGERQRLALARALVIDPDWLFLDEPTSQLDGPSRNELVESLTTQLSRTNAGVVLATHQVDLGLRLSQRIALMLDGRLVQVGDPVTLYTKPVNLAAARLFGPAAEWRGVVRDGEMLEGACAIMHSLSVDGERTVLFRPEDVQLELDDSAAVTVERCDFAGDRWIAHVATPGGQRAMVACAARVAPRARVRLRMRVA